MSRSILIIFIIISFSLTLMGLGYTGDLETISFTSYEKSDWKMTMKGHFSKPGLVGPNEDIFSLTGESVPLIYFDALRYRFTGRTGDKTFEMQHTFDSSSAALKVSQKVNMYLDETLYHLSFYPLSAPLYSDCTKEDKVLLRMIKLEGNQLEYQIILPRCLNRSK